MPEQEEWVHSPAEPPHLVRRVAALTFEHVLSVKTARREVLLPAAKSDNGLRDWESLEQWLFVLKARYEHAGDKKEK